MVANIISKYTFTLRDMITVSEYEIAGDADYDGKSQITVHRKPIAEEEDFLILHDGDLQYQGIVDNIENAENESHYVITMIEMPRLFDQKVILAGEQLLQTGIEDFIADQITRNFIENPDNIVNIRYLTVIAKTHTPVAAKVSTENGIYNLCTYIGNALTNYGVFISFQFTQNQLKIVLEKKEQNELKIDTGISDIVELSETYEVKALTKLTVIWKQETPSNDPEVEPEVAESVRHFYLTTDRTITEDMGHPDRAKGTTDVVVVQAETEAAMIQEARNQFASNSYQHKIAFGLLGTSRIVPAGDMYIGHKCIVKTKQGIKDSIISGITRSSGSSVIGVTLGKLKVGLIEKLKGVEKQK